MFIYVEIIGGDVLTRFEKYAKELDIYSKEGMFQESIKSLMKKRDEMELNDYLNASLNLWIETDEQIGKKCSQDYSNIFIFNN